MGEERLARHRGGQRVQPPGPPAVRSTRERRATSTGRARAISRGVPWFCPPSRIARAPRLKTGSPLAGTAGDRAASKASASPALHRLVTSGGREPVPLAGEAARRREARAGRARARAVQVWPGRRPARDRRDGRSGRVRRDRRGWPHHRMQVHPSRAERPSARRAGLAAARHPARARQRTGWRTPAPRRRYQSASSGVHGPSHRKRSR